MATLPTTPYTRTWWKIFLPKKMRTKMVSYPPESLLTNTMNFNATCCPATHSLLPVSVYLWWKYFEFYGKDFLRLPEHISVLQKNCVNSVKIYVVGFEPKFVLLVIFHFSICVCLLLQELMNVILPNLPLLGPRSARHF